MQTLIYVGKGSWVPHLKPSNFPVSEIPENFTLEGVLATGLYELEEEGDVEVLELLPPVIEPEVEVEVDDEEKSEE